jgi:hypothetical protein
MSLITASGVREILPSETALTDVQITASIRAADSVVTRVASCDTDLTSTDLVEIERYLAAHFCAVTENSLTLTSEVDPCNGGNVVYGFRFGNGILGTSFGQMANTLSGGLLIEFDKQPVNFFSIGVC